MTYDLFPPPQAFATGTLSLDETHVMYWEQSGSAQGQPVVVLHGGPGAGMEETQQRLFDPRHYRVVSFDQRGAGRSLPAGELRDNTTSHLVSDLESLRKNLGIERWLVFGGSWGSSLALAYAESCPGRVTGLILRGIYLCREREIKWFLNGLRNVFPEAWQRFIDFLPSSERRDPLSAYQRRLLDPDPNQHLPAARAWCTYEASCSTLLPSTELSQSLNEQQALVLARIQTHYFKRGFFVAEAALLDGVERIRAIPGVIVQGRYDMICPMISADQLHRAWPEARYQVIANAGHSAMEPGIRRALVAATERFKLLQ